MKYFVAFLAVMGLILLLIILLFHGGSTPKKIVTPRSLLSYENTDAQVRLTTEGPVVANQNYQYVQITVDKNNVSLTQLTGYEGQVTSLNNFSSNESAYQVFLRALNTAGFTYGNSSKLLADERGYCPLGERFIVEIINNGTDVQRFWTSSCGKSVPSTFYGNINLTIQLFQAQVPNYSGLTENLNF